WVRVVHWRSVAADSRKASRHGTSSWARCSWCGGMPRWSRQNRSRSLKVSRYAAIVWGLALRWAGRYWVKKAVRYLARSVGCMRRPPWNDVPKRGFTPRAQIREYVGSQLQVTLRFVHTQMAHIGRQHRQESLEICAGTIPLL